MSAFQLERTAQLWGISGNLGGGKTMTAVQFAVNAVKEGYFVVSNITLNVDRMCSDFGAYCSRLYMHIDLDDPSFDPFKIPCGSPRGSGGRKRVLVILDECAEWVDQYSSAKDPRISRLWSWLRHSSKRSQDVFVVVQRPDYLNKVIRILISRWIWVNDLAVWRIPILRARLPFCGNLILRSIFDAKGQRVGPMSFIRKDYWGRFYDTSECLNSDGATYAAEYVSVDRPEPSLRWLYFFWFLSLFFLFKGVNARNELRPCVPRSFGTLKEKIGFGSRNFRFANSRCRMAAEVTSFNVECITCALEGRRNAPHGGEVRTCPPPCGASAPPYTGLVI